MATQLERPQSARGRAGPGRLAGALGSVLIGVVRVYQWTLSSWLPPRCRYLPTCSDYAIVALRRFGPWRGSWLALRRILRCHPWGGSGYDPVPVRADEQRNT